jgi:fibronectin type 3 domain-containing protein
VVYRFLGGSRGSLAEPRNILATVRNQTGNSQVFIDRTAWTGCAYTYVVTAVDRLHNESPASNAVSIPR